MKYPIHDSFKRHKIMKGYHQKLCKHFSSGPRESSGSFHKETLRGQLECNQFNTAFVSAKNDTERASWGGEGRKASMVQTDHTRKPRLWRYLGNPYCFP